VARSEQSRLLFRTDNLDATFERLRPAGDAGILQEPLSQPWGARCRLPRPAGNLLRISRA
jgi:uncharacterized glyoxalase superfamily protein PhnB